MIVAVTGGSLLLGLVLGWYGYKANLRIARWGEALWAQDREAQLEYADSMVGYAQPVMPGGANGTVRKPKLVKPIPVAH